MIKCLRQYLETALWSSDDDNGIPLDRDYIVEDIDCESLDKQAIELQEFINKAGDLYEYDLTDIAHDFWLTRNRHGAGFWDGDYPEAVGIKLTELSHTFPEVNLIVGDNGKLYFV